MDAVSAGYVEVSDEPILIGGPSFNPAEHTSRLVPAKSTCDRRRTLSSASCETMQGEFLSTFQVITSA
jgi:hypothetical protein